MATPENRSDLRSKIRARLSAWPDDVGTLGAAISTTTATSATLAAALDIPVKGLLQIDDEVMRVKTYVAAGTAVGSILRGDRGTTAATHTNGSVVSVYPIWGWTDYDINREIDAAIDWLYPEVWVLTVLTNTLLSGYKDFGLPSGYIYPNGAIIKKVELLDTTVSPNIYREILGWQHKSDRLILSLITTQTYTARIWVQGKHARLTSDATQLTNSDPVEAIIYYACSNLLEQLLANRVRYTEYSAALNDRASTPDELQRQAYYFKNQAVVAKDRISRPGLSGMASIRREG
jgi:hypothetical protein